MSTSTIDASSDLARLAAREHVLRLLALAFSSPSSQRFARIFDPDLQEVACAAARHLATEAATRPVLLARGEVSPSRLDLTEVVRSLRVPERVLVDDDSRVFGLVVSKECPPYEVQYCPQTFSIYRSQRLADVAGFYRAFGLAPGRDMPERADHIACELEFLAWLVAKERYARSREEAHWTDRAEVCRDAQRDFLTEHFVWWVPAFACALGQRARSLTPPARLQVALADVMAALVPAERAFLDIEPPKELAEPQQDESEDPCAGCDVQ